MTTRNASCCAPSTSLDQAAGVREPSGTAPMRVLDSCSTRLPCFRCCSFPWLWWNSCLMRNNAGQANCHVEDTDNDRKDNVFHVTRCLVYVFREYLPNGLILFAASQSDLRLSCGCRWTRSSVETAANLKSNQESQPSTANRACSSTQTDLRAIEISFISSRTCKLTICAIPYQQTAVPVDATPWTPHRPSVSNDRLYS